MQVLTRTGCLFRSGRHCHSARLAALLLLNLLAFGAAAQSLDEVTARSCVYGDCENGRGTLELRTPYGSGRYVGDFVEGEFHGYGRLEVPISFNAKEVYVGDWVMGIREGRGKHWNGEGNLYIGRWRNNKRHGHGSYFINLPSWEENRHTEFWLRENTENYTGDFVNDHYQGQGVYRWPNGARYEGGFFASDKHGPGTFYYETGTARQQLWNYGDFVR